MVATQEDDGEPPHSTIALSQDLNYEDDSYYKFRLQLAPHLFVYCHQIFEEFHRHH
jgi:hypothetical protein